MGGGVGTNKTAGGNKEGERVQVGTWSTLSRERVGFRQCWFVTASYMEGVCALGHDHITRSGEAITSQTRFLMNTCAL